MNIEKPCQLEVESSAAFISCLYVVDMLFGVCLPSDEFLFKQNALFSTSRVNYNLSGVTEVKPGISCSVRIVPNIKNHVPKLLLEHSFP